MSETGIAVDFSLPDSISPAQFHEMWSGSCERSAEFRLALAVLEQALEDFHRHRTARVPEYQRLYRKACRWLLTIDRGWPYSFINVCELLDVPSDRIRAYVLACHALNHDAEPVRPSQASGDATSLACDT